MTFFQLGNVGLADIEADHREVPRQMGRQRQADLSQTDNGDFIFSCVK